jgi:hypothetical protein
MKIEEGDYYIPTDRLKNSIKDRDDNIKSLTEMLNQERLKVTAAMDALRRVEKKFEELRQMEIQWLEELHKRYNFDEFRKRLDFLMRMR